jgi:glutamate-1-semialdehyde 2,1-aminomutase
MTRRYVRSEAQLDRARKSIPLGSQTFSKSITQFPRGVSPYFAQRAQGSRLWDIDGNEYIDFVNALAAVTLGYADPDVNAAVAAELANGTIYSLSHPLEAEVAELICDLVPSAEMVRFGKNGSDATAGAIRIARAFTGRDHVITCGYHGWQDWFIGTTTRNKGVPAATSALAHAVPYNDLAAVDAVLAALDGQVAALILEPMNVTPPQPDYLAQLRERVHEAGALLIFDEMITGFRFAPGGAQELFGITPDLTTLGKGMANGFPLSAVCGRRDVMMEMEQVFFSFTMGGETLSLAAAKATMTKLKREPVIATMRARGGRLMREVAALIERHEVGKFVSLAGEPTWSFLLFNDVDGVSSWEIKTLWMQELMQRGFLCLGSHNMSYAHSEDDVDRLTQAYDHIFPLLRAAVANRAVRQYLNCEPLQPLFKVRG